MIYPLHSSIHWLNQYPFENSIAFAGTYPIESDLSSRDPSLTPVLATPTGGSDFVSRVFSLSLDPQKFDGKFYLKRLIPIT